MNNIWSNFIQTTDELYHSRDTRFNDCNKALWLNAIGVESGQNILEDGCASSNYRKAKNDIWKRCNRYPTCR